MNPLQKKKIDMSALNEEEKKMLSKYGKLPQRKDLLSNKLNERKYFDSGDYALSKAGKASDAGTQVGSQFPQPENIPHSPAAGGAGGAGGVVAGAPPGANHHHHAPSSSFSSGSSPVKDSALLSQNLPSSTQAYSKDQESAVADR